MDNFGNAGIDVVSHLGPDTLAAIRDDFIFAKSKSEGKDLLSPETLCFIERLIDGARLVIERGLENYTRMQCVIDDREEG
jgi:hypothetical protein